MGQLINTSEFPRRGDELIGDESNTQRRAGLLLTEKQVGKEKLEAKCVDCSFKKPG